MMAAKKIAEKSDWKTEDMPEKNTTIQLNVAFNEKEMAEIKKGTIPKEMEDKWFLYYVENENKFYMHRSWTGRCIYIVSFEKIEEGYAATSAVVNRDPDQYRCIDDDQDKQRCIKMIGALQLGQSGKIGTPLENWAVLGRASLQPKDD